MTTPKLPYFLDVADVWGFLLLLNSKRFPLSPRKMKTEFNLTRRGLKIKNAWFVQGMQFVILNFNTSSSPSWLPYPLWHAD
jgi:hypothetical protein